MKKESQYHANHTKKIPTKMYNNIVAQWSSKQCFRGLHLLLTMPK